jgi:hypothetical protein
MRLDWAKGTLPRKPAQGGGVLGPMGEPGNAVMGFMYYTTCLLQDPLSMNMNWRADKRFLFARR